MNLPYIYAVNSTLTDPHTMASVLRRVDNVTGPAAEPVSRTEMKKHLRVGHTTDNTLIDGIIAVARMLVEKESRQAYVARVVDAYYGDPGDEVRLPLMPYRALTEIYTSYEGTETEVTSTNVFVVKGNRTKLRLKSGYTWGTTYDELRVRYTVGFATLFTADESTDVLTATGHTYSNGDIVRLYNSGGALPAGLSDHTDYYVIGVSGATLQLSTSEGGNVVNFTDDGTGSNYLGEVPRPLMQALMITATDLYQKRGSISTGTIVQRLPHTARMLITPYRAY